MRDAEGGVPWRFGENIPVDLGFEPISSDPLAPNYVPGMFFAPAWLSDHGYSTWFASANGALPIWLDAESRVEGVFAHGKIYALMSRVTDPENLRAVGIPPKDLLEAVARAWAAAGPDVDECFTQL